MKRRLILLFQYDTSFNSFYKFGKNFKVTDFKVTVRSGEVKSKLYREHLCLTMNKNGKVNTIEASG